MSVMRAATVLLLLAGLALTATGQASAHARYEDSTPAKGELLASSPADVSITFSQDIQKISGTYTISVKDAAGTEWTSGPAVISDSNRASMSAPLQAALPANRYIVRWTNVSDADGDPAEGAFSFYVAVRPTDADLAADAELESIGLEEETPAAGETPSTGRTATTQATPQGSTPAAATAVATSTSRPSSDDDDDNTALVTLVFVAAAIAAGAIVGYVGWRIVKSRGDG
jgi:methionine-rich copper-binding protein CopC